jgi:signal transduction histidine kinase/CheY-like chemotaxis protein
MAHFPDRGVREPRAPIPYLVLVAGLVATLATGLYVHRTAEKKDELRFDGAAEHLRTAIATRLDTYVALLRAGAGLFAANPDVSAEQFRNFVARLDLRDRYPGIQGIGFAKRATAAELPAVARQVEAGGVEPFVVWPDTARANYFPIVYLEPLDRRNRAAIGYDMYTDPVRHAAMERAARMAAPSASGRVTLVQEIDPEKQAGFLIYVPVYGPGGEPATETERMAALRGFVYSPFRAGDFLAALLRGELSAELEVRIYDGSTDVKSALLFDDGPVPGGGIRATRGGASSRLANRTMISVAGQPWLVETSPGRRFEMASERRFLPWILLIGFSVSFILFIFTVREVRARAGAEQAARELLRSQEALRASEAELRRLVDAERQAHHEAEAANRAKDDFLATLSHELRTPLNAILGWASMLIGGRLSAAQQERGLDVIARNARTQAQLIDDLLDVSRIITGKLRVDLQPAQLATSAYAAVDAVRPVAQEKGVALEFESATDGPVLGDPDRLQQVVWNLLSNALKFTPSGGRVAASLVQNDHHVTLTVRDTGIGIDPSFLPFVFERFRQHDSSTTRTHGGMGLGLAIVRHLVELHQGTVRAASEGAGRGATFTVTLPLLTAGAASATAGPPTDNATPEHDDLGGVRALVVDDEADSREMLASALRQAGADVVTASSADEALDALEQGAVDVLLADISMPGTDGYTLLREVRGHVLAAVRSLPAIAVTAHAHEEDREKAEGAGFNLHVAKPVDIAALRDAVRRLADAVRT